MLDKEIVKDYIGKVENYLSDLGIEISYDEDISDSYCDLYWYTIHIPKKETVDYILFSLLHEGGHFLVESENVYGSGVVDEVDTMINEVLAWEAGLDIVESCGIVIDREEYYNTSKVSLEKYLRAYRRKK